MEQKKIKKRYLLIIFQLIFFIGFFPTLNWYYRKKTKSESYKGVIEDIFRNESTRQQLTLIKRMVDDLNKIYSAKYANSIPAFSYTSTTKEESVKTNSFDLFSPSTWFSDAKYETVRTNEYQLKVNEDFDWSKDKYTNAMKEVIDDPFRVQVSSVLDENGSFLRDYGGGFTEPVSSIKLSSKLSNFGDKGTTGKFPKQWTIGGVFLHEILYHVHYLGILEHKAYGKDNVPSAPNVMRAHYNTKTGTYHPPFN